MRVEFDSKKVIRMLEEMRERARNLRPIFRVIGRNAVRSVQQNFDVEGRPEGWEPLKQSSLESKAKNLGGGGHRIKKKSGEYNVYFKRIAKGNKILTDKSTLRNSVTTDVQSHHVDIGPGILPYARIHQKGFDGKRKDGVEMHMPARPYCILQEDEPEKYAKMMSEYITRGRT